MMRSASFLILSLSLHAAALFYPISFGRSQAHLIDVTLASMEQEGAAAIDPSSGPPATQAAHRLDGRRPIAGTVRRKESSNDLPQQTLPAQMLRTPTAADIALGRSPEDGPVPQSVEPDSTTQGNSEPVIGSAGFGGGEGSLGSFGIADGRGSGSSAPGTGLTVTQARYRETPRPQYPESARREGREGRVLLRVLIDNRGRSREVEINRTSGSAALDDAAAEAIKHWRFHPALYGDQPVESWLRIPIEFRLADAKSN
jgi:periplasmic protein TonB